MNKIKSPRIGITDTGTEDEQYRYRVFGGFWKLIKTKETPYVKGKKQKIISKKQSISMLIELDAMSILWKPDTNKGRAYPIHIYRKRLITNDFFSGNEIRAKYNFNDDTMSWKFVENINQNSYSLFEYEFIKEK
jgi:hypothetical protein